MKKILFSMILVLFSCTQAPAESSVWKVQKGGATMYLGGTCHLLRPSDFPLPAEFEQAYRESEIIVLETDVGGFNDPAIQAKLMSSATYADGTTIDKHISSQTYALLTEYCTSRGISLETLKHFRPSMITMMITVMELNKLGVSQEGVDMFFYNLAAKDQKPIEGLETVDEQIRFMTEMGQGDEDALITHTINETKSLEEQYGRLVDAWRTGDIPKLYDFMVSELKVKTPGLYKKLLYDRNKNWLPLIDAYQKTPKKEFILVGVAHLVGPEGLIESLIQKGYEVEKL